MESYIVTRLRREEHYIDAENDEEARQFAALLAADRVQIPRESWMDAGAEGEPTVERVEFTDEPDPADPEAFKIIRHGFV